MQEFVCGTVPGGFVIRRDEWAGNSAATHCRPVLYRFKISGAPYSLVYVYFLGVWFCKLPPISCKSSHSDSLRSQS